MKALFIHGIEDRGASWAPTCAALGEDIECLAPDLPWQMFTDFVWLSDLSPEEAVRRLLDTVRPDLCVAHSFGALALVEALLRCPEEHRPRGMVLVAPFYLSGDERLDWYLLDRTRAEFSQLMRDSIVSRTRRAGRTIDAETLDDMITKIMSGINPLAFTQLFGHFALMRRRRLEDVGVAGRLVGSADDPGFTGARAIELSTRLGLELTLVPGRDHFLHYTAPEIVADTVRSLLVKESRT
jgi:pimeloyl-ACP methyl ester carboxylesterase